MRNLEKINPRGLRPSRFTSFVASVAMCIALICIPFAWGAAPEIPVGENPIIHLLLSVLIGSLALAISSIVYSWDWRARYFGFSMLCVSSVSLVALVPMLAVVLFGIFPRAVKVSIVLLYVLTHIWWCRKFIVLYEEIFENTSLRNILYEEDEDAVYYKRRGEKYILKMRDNFSLMPPGRYFVIFISLGVMLMPAMGALGKLTGVPFSHVFLTVAMLPVSWMSTGLAVRGLLVCYRYPARIKRATGKEVYVDLTTGFKKNTD